MSSDPTEQETATEPSPPGPGIPGLVVDGLSDEEIARQAALFGPLAQSVRELADAALRTDADEDVVRAATSQIAQLAGRLRERQLPATFGLRIGASGQPRAWGNAVIGLRNPIAPPLDIHHEPDGRIWAEFELGAVYEGPPRMVHGGVAALILDHMLGQAAAVGGAPGMTGTLTVRYLRATPLGALHAEAKIDRVEGSKTIVTGRLADAKGVCVEAEGVFILPRWVRAARGS